MTNSDYFILDNISQCNPSFLIIGKTDAHSRLLVEDIINFFNKKSNYKIIIISSAEKTNPYYICKFSNSVVKYKFDNNFLEELLSNSSDQNQILVLDNNISSMLFNNNNILRLLTLKQFPFIICTDTVSTNLINSFNYVFVKKFSDDIKKIGNNITNKIYKGSRNNIIDYLVIDRYRSLINSSGTTNKKGLKKIQSTSILDADN